MTDREKAIVMAYTGTAMLKGEKLNVFYEYIAEICGRPLYSYELSKDSVCDEIKDKSRADFIRLCAEDTGRVGYWLHQNDDRNDWLVCSECDYGSEGEVKWGEGTSYCPCCGAKMEAVK